MMYLLYLGKILKALQRQLSASEIDKVIQCFENGYSVNYAIELLN